MMAELETEGLLPLRLRPFIVAMGDLGRGSAHHWVVVEEFTRTTSKDMQMKKVIQRYYIMCGTKASTICKVCHKPSESIVAYLCGPYTGGDYVAQHVGGVPSRCRRVLSGVCAHTCTGPSKSTLEAELHTVRD